MTLSFSTEINGKKSFFIEKIWKSFVFQSNKHEYASAYLEQFGGNWDVDSTRNLKPKNTTIRKDENNRWHAGKDIHFVINNRTSNRFQFAPIAKAVSTQRIEIDYSGSCYKQVPIIRINRTIGDYLVLDPCEMDPITYAEQVQFIAENDGFETWMGFLEYFNEDFSGKVIHWTPLRF